MNAGFQMAQPQVNPQLYQPHDSTVPQQGTMQQQVPQPEMAGQQEPVVQQEPAPQQDVSMQPQPVASALEETGITEQLKKN